MKKFKNINWNIVLEKIKPWLFLMPLLIFLLLFRVLPLFQTLRLALYDEVTKISRTGIGFGFDTLVNVWNDEVFQKGIKNTFWLVIIVVPFSITLGFTFAYLLNIKTKIRNILETSYFLPYIIPMVAFSYAMILVFNYDGMLNHTLSWVGIEPVAWLNDGSKKMMTLSIFTVISTLPFISMLYLMSLQGVNKNLIDLSIIEGDNWFKRIRKVILPSVKSTSWFLFISLVLGTFKIFTSVNVMFGGVGDNNELMTLVYYIRNAMNEQNWNVSAAASIYLLLFCASFVLIRHFVSKLFKAPSNGHHPRTNSFVVKNKKIRNTSTAFTIVIVLSMLLPMILLILQSFMTIDDSLAGKLIPRSISFEAIIYVWNNSNIVGAFINSIINAVIQTGFTIGSAILAAYALSHLKFKGKEVIMVIIVLLMAVPSEILYVQNFLNLDKWGFKSTFFGLAAPFMVSCYYTILLTKKFETTSLRTKEASRVAGDSEFQYITMVLIPSSMKWIVMIAITKIVSTWSQFLWPLMIADSDLETIAVAIRNYGRSNNGYQNYQMAMALLGIIPVIIIYFTFKKYIIRKEK